MPPSRPRRRGTPAEPPRAPFRAQEDYSCHVDAPRLKPRRNQAREPQNRSTPAISRRGAESPATPAAGRSPFRPEPLDPESTRTIRTWADPIWTARSRSSGRYLRIPVRPGLIAKEPLHFLLFNPHSQSVQKYFLFSPKFDAQPPELSKYRTRRPSSVISRVRPQNYPLIMF